MEKEQTNVCVVCFKTVEIFSVGVCDHVVCFDCSTRMRVLCRQNVCSICRQEMQLVIFSGVVKPFEELKSAARLYDKKYNIAFVSQKIQDEFYKLLQHKCTKCKNKTFPNFQQLNDHMRRDHELFYCDLCLVNIKILSTERKCYTRTDLARHRRKGDPDDTSHRGHPLCEFCDTRFIDNDDLFRHLRRDHLYCHFCDADGLHMYYSSYDHLREHFRDEHFLCEEGNCHEEKFTPVFRTEIDLRAHRASEHSRTIGKAATKQARTLEVEFTLKPRPRPQDNRRGRVYERSPEEEGAVASPQTAPTPSQPSLDLNDFPSLGGSSKSSSTPLTNIAPPIQRSGAVMIRAVGRKGPGYDQHFPGLPGGSGTPATSVQLNINQERKPGANQNVAQQRPNLSIHVNHRPVRKPDVKQDDFPALSSGSSGAEASSKWVSVTSKKKSNNSAPAAVKPAKPPKTREEDFPSLCSKFTTNLNFTSSEPVQTNFVNIKSTLNKPKPQVPAPESPKKASSVSIHVDGSWPAPDAAASGTKAKTKKKKKGGSDDTAKKKDDKSPEKVKNSKKFKEEGKEKTSSVATGKKALETVTSPSRSVASEKKALETVTSPAVATGSKPLPTAADWFGRSSPKNVSCDNFEEDDVSQSPPLSASVSMPPPGFAPMTANAPPGFAVPPTNGFTFTNSSGENFPIRPFFPYIPPHDADVRNVRLITKINEILLDEGSLDNFRHKSAQFRNGDISADDYYELCLQIMGKSGTGAVLHELLVLLPDIVKQQELLHVIEKNNANKKGKCRLESCRTCQQVIYAFEVKQHVAAHVVDLNSWDYL